MIKEILREKFWEQIEKEMERNKNIWLLYIDLGFPWAGRLQKKFPDRCINTGLIEQSAIGIACGLALMKKKVYVYSTSTFLLFRAWEQIRNDIAYQGIKNITLIGTIGKQYNFLGPTHMIKNDEDLKLLETLPRKINYIRLL